MGSVFSKPKTPQKSQEQIDAEQAEKDRLAKVESDTEADKLDEERKTTSNLTGRRSLQAAQMEGYTGYRRKQMGAATPTPTGSMGQSIRK